MRGLVGRPQPRGPRRTVQAWRVPIAKIQERNYNLDLKNPHTVAEDHGDPEELLADLQAAELKAAELRDQLKAILAEALLR